jgi:hypothetical protein
MKGHFIFLLGKYGQISAQEKMKEIICIVYKVAVLPKDVLMPFSWPMSWEATRIRGCLRQYI